MKCRISILLATVPLTALLAGVAGPVSAQPRAGGGQTPIAIENATVYTAPETAIEGATVVIRDGEIQSVGKNVRVPAGARVIDAAGKIVTAGLIDASTTLGLVEVSQVSEANDGHFSKDADDKIHAAYRVTDSYHDGSVAIPVARLGGVTSAITAPRGSLVSGQSAYYSLAPGSPVIQAPLAMHANLGSGPMGGSSRGLVIEKLRELLDDAVTYGRVQGRYSRNQTRPFAADRLDLEALQAVVRGRIPLVIRAHRASDIRAALALRKELGIRLVIAGGAEAWLVAVELAAAKVPVLLDPVSNLPYDFDRVRVRPDAAARLHQAGVPIAISTLGETANVRRLRQLAGNAVAGGLDWEQALAAVTTAPAEIFRIDKRGAIRPGFAADVVVWSGDPLELSSHPETVIIGGAEVPQVSRQTLLRDRYRQLAR